MRKANTSALPHHLFILPPYQPRAIDDLTLLVLADGNRRSSSESGYAGGARRVIAIAEHLAERPDVAVMIACILSTDNVAKRGQDFFAELHREFIALGVAVATQRTLISHRIRMDVGGDLRALYARGESAAALAAAIEEVCAMTAGIDAPALHLLLGVGYDQDTVTELDVDIVLRTGMEEPGVLRLSGLRTREDTLNVASTTLWPDVEPGEINDAIERYKRSRSPRYEGGFDLTTVVDFITSLARLTTDTPVRVALPTTAPNEAIVEAFDHLYATTLADAPIAVALVGEDPPMRGPRSGDRHEVRLLPPLPQRYLELSGEVASVLAPGQAAPSFILPNWFPLGSANVFACETTVSDMMRAIGDALAFADKHPALLGRDRRSVLEHAPRPIQAASPSASRERERMGDRFVEETFGWARSSGLMVPGRAWETAAAAYALTALLTHLRIPIDPNEHGAEWEGRAGSTARYMILVAAGDEAIFDRVIEGESREQRWARLEASAGFLGRSLSLEGSRAPVPDIPGHAVLAAIAAGWRSLFDTYQHRCHPDAASSFRAGVERLYAASLAEHQTRSHHDPMNEGALQQRITGAPPPVADRARALLQDALNGDPNALDDLRVLLHVSGVSASIGAGLLFQTAALAVPAHLVTSRSIQLLDATASMLDCQVRLANDVSGVLSSPTGDRDPKENACTILIPPDASGPSRARALIRSLASAKRLSAWLDKEVAAGMSRVARDWPYMGTILRRGAWVGKRVYEVGHYTTITRAQMGAIFDEAEGMMGEGG